jgi:hypothetical protein
VKYTFVVLTEAIEGKEDEYNDWYTNTHLADVLKLKAFVSAQRFRFAAVDGPDATPPLRKYLALYEIETDDLQVAWDELINAIDTEKMVFSEAFNKDAALAWFFEPITDKLADDGSSAQAQAESSTA